MVVSLDRSFSSLTRMIEVAIQTRNEIKLATYIGVSVVYYTARLYVSGDEGERICLSNGLCLEDFV